MCMFCGETKPDKVVQIHSSHYACYFCLRTHVRAANGGPLILLDKERLAPNFSPDSAPAKPVKCPARNCPFRFELDVIRRTMQKREFEVALGRALRAAGIMPSPKSAFSPKHNPRPTETCTCAICQSTFDGADGFELECHDTYCKICMGTYLESCFTDGKGVHGVICPAENCKSPIDIHIIKELLGPEKLAVLEQRSIRQRYKVFECVNCGAAFIIPPDMKSRVLTCVECGETMCRLCKQAAHDGVCRYRQKVSWAKRIK